MNILKKYKYRLNNLDCANCANKIEERLKKENNFIIEVDGGINNDTISKVNSDIYVVGSYITNSHDYQKQIDSLKKM